MPRRKKEEQPREQIKTIKTPSLARGMKDFLPADEKYYDYLENEIGRLVRDYSFKRIITPVLERYELFNHTLYKQFGAFERDAIYFVDHGEKVCLRPEMMSAICRSYIEHNMAVQPLPIKLYYIAPVFRQGRGDAGKQRQFLQAGFAIIGDKAPAIDAELIIISHFLLKNVGLSAEVKLNSLGCPICRPGYKKALQEYLRFKRNMVPAELRKIVAKEPLKVFTCSGQKCQKLIEDAPQVVDYLCDDCRAHLFKVLEYLDELQVAYKLDPAFSPEFDYHSKTAFEIRTTSLDKEQQILASGGRIDNLIEMIGGPNTPSAGVSFNLERIINEIKNCKCELPAADKPDVFVAQISEMARQKAFKFFEDLRKERFSVRTNLSKGNLKAQLDYAKKLEARLILILGQKEVSEGTVILREQESGIQEVVNANKVVLEVKKRLKEMK